MRNHLTVSNTDLTPYIVDGTYKMDTKDAYESWEDGNMMEHRVVVTSKVEGSFDIGCSNRSGGITLAHFLELWADAVDNKVATIGVYVPSVNQFKAIDCYYTITSKEHILSGDGEFIDVLTVKIQER